LTDPDGLQQAGRHNTPGWDSHTQEERNRYAKAYAKEWDLQFNFWLKGAKDRERDATGFDGQFKFSFPPIAEWLEQDYIDRVMKGLAAPNPLDEYLQYQQFLEDVKNGNTLRQQFDKNPDHFTRLTKTPQWEAAVKGTGDDFRLFVKIVAFLPGPVGLGFLLADAGLNLLQGNVADGAMSLAVFVLLRRGSLFGKVQGHHPIPRFLGGNDRQILTGLPQPIHREFHVELDRILRREGFPLGGIGGSGNSTQAWTAYLNANPGSQQRALRCVLEASAVIDGRHGTNLVNDVWKNMARGGFNPNPAAPDLR
jgi:hypothetical protein